MSSKRRYCQVGLGSRCRMYTGALLDSHSQWGEIVGFCDINPGRLAGEIEFAKEAGADIPGYDAADFGRMLAETKPDCVVVTTKDCHHDEYICAALEAGCDAITEKPMTTDAAKCHRIVDTVAKTGRSCVVTFNYRYSPPRTQIKDLLMSGVIGDVKSIDFHWLLNTSHGADYFRRWHRNKANSGGLLVHKATHHFDLVNWWLSDVPERVYATGARNFYTPETAERYGLSDRSERCLDCPEAEKCSFHFDPDRGRLRKLYFDNEKHDGYFRDRCVFSADIDIEDTMHLAVDYAGGASMSYSLHSFMPWEGYVVSFNGSRGRLEHKCMESVYISGDGTVPGELDSEGTTTRIYPHWKPGRAVEVWTGKGGHGGGDKLLLDDLFKPDKADDKYLRAADHRGGAYSILTGAAANVSIESGEPVIVADLVKGIELPDYPAMPNSSEPLEM